MRQLFAVYGRRHVRPLAVGQVAGVGARAMELVPPILLGFAIDTVLLETRPFGLPLVPDAWIPADQTAQFALVAVLIAGSFGMAAVFNWIRAGG